MFFLGWLAFGEQITLPQLVAGALVISAIWMSSVKPSKDVFEEVEVVLPPPSIETSASKAKHKTAIFMPIPEDTPLLASRS